MFMQIVLFIAVFAFVVMVLDLILVDNEQLLMERMEGFNVYGLTEKERRQNEPLLDRIYKNLETLFVRRFNSQLSQGKGFAPLQLKLYQAGMNIDPIQFRAKRFIFAFVFGGLAMLTANYRLVLIVTVIGFLFPDYQLNKRMEERKFQIKEELPDFADLLAAVFPGCNGFEDALSKICSRYDTIISREFQRVIDEIGAGINKKDALKGLAMRCGIPQIDGLVTQIIQTEMLGTEMAETLKMQALRMREMKKQNSEIKARNASLALLMPSFFLLITILIVIAGPSILQFMEVMTVL